MARLVLQQVTRVGAWARLLIKFTGKWWDAQLSGCFCGSHRLHGLFHNHAVQTFLQVLFFPSSHIKWEGKHRCCWSLRLLPTVVKQSLGAAVVHVGLLEKLCSIQWNRTWLPAFFSQFSLVCCPLMLGFKTKKSWKTDGLMWDVCL